MNKKKKKSKKKLKVECVSFGKMMDDYFSRINSLEELDYREKYNVFHKNMWLGKVYYKIEGK
jgi:hypothetical protein